MCLILISWQTLPSYPLVVAANRDEFYARPSANAKRWEEAPQIIAGKDLEAGGTWLGMTEQGRFAAITNVREPGMAKGEISRGKLTQDFLLSTDKAIEYAEKIDAHRYAGFNLLLCDGITLLHVSNRAEKIRLLSPGIYGLSNHSLDTPWPKLIQAKKAFSEALLQLPDESAFFELLSDKTIVPDHLLPKTGVTLEWERVLSAIFVQSENYGTRASTLVYQQQDGCFTLHEKTFGPDGKPLQSSVISTLV